MRYIYTFDIGSILFFSLTIYFYGKQRRIRDLADRLFFRMLLCGLVALVFDCASAMLEYIAGRIPVPLLYASNMLFILAMQTCLPLFYIYVNVITGEHYKTSARRYFLILLPYLATMLLLLASPFGTFGICYIDAGHSYQSGATHFMLYVNSFVYVTASIITLFRNYRSIQRAKRNVTLLFMALLFLAIILQITFPRYLLTASATALALTSMFYVLQSPIDRIEPCTGAFSRMLLPGILTDYHGRKQPYTLALFSLHSFEEIIRLYGSQLSDSLLRELTGILQRTFPQETVIYMDTWEFTVVFQRVLSAREVAAIAGRIPDTIVVSGVPVPIEMRLAAVPYDSESDPAETLSTADYLLRQIRVSPTDGVLYADLALRKSCSVLLALASSLDDVMQQGVPSLQFAPIYRADKTPVSEDVSLHIAHPGLANVPYPQFLQAIGQGGYVWEYYRTLFSLLATRAGRYSATFPLCVQLSAAGCMQDDAANMLFDIATNAGFAPKAVTFFMSEADIAAALPVQHDNIRHLHAYGFGFRMDAFAVGYTDLSQLTSLPVDAVKLDSSLVHDARQGGRQLALLSGILRILAGLNKSVVCAGVDTESDHAIAVAAGATLLQGAYFAE